MKKPNFLFIGPSKSGSTWIYEYLKMHPEVFVPEIKDIYYFDKNFHKGDIWYEKFFMNSDRKAIGELSHDYFSSEISLKRIKKFNKDFRLICCLRNPIDRAWSSYKFHVRNGYTKDFFHAVKEFPDIIEEGLYNKHISNLKNLFQEQNLLILDFEDLKKDPSKLCIQITNFLNISKFLPSELLGKVINPASKPRSKFLSKLTKATANFFRKINLNVLVGLIKQNKFILHLLYIKEVKHEKIPDEIKEYLKKCYSIEEMEYKKLIDINKNGK